MPNNSNHRKTLGLALSGGGNRSTFYIGFLEVLAENAVPIDYIAACSGASLAAAAFACGTLPEFKEEILNLTKDGLKKYISRGSGGGGFYSTDLLEEAIRKFTKGLSFEDTRPLMGFLAVDIENGEKIVLSMGDIARAARISCSLPGIFEPVKWGGKTLVDGGLLTMVPGDVLKRANVDVSIGVNMRGTKHIFTDRQIQARQMFNFFKKIFLIDEIENLINSMLKFDQSELDKNPKIFTVLGKSLDLAILANKNSNENDEACDLLITPKISKFKRAEFTPQLLQYYCEMGRQTALEYLPKIKEFLD